VLNRLLLLGAVEQKTRIDAAMLREVLGELDDDGAIALVSPQPKAVAAATPFAAAPATATAIDTAATAAMIEAALAHRDMQIDELQRAILELAAVAGDARHAPAPHGDGAAVAVLQEQLAQAQAQVAGLEARVAEQEATLRHMLTMLIEWFEGGEGHRAAA